MIPNIEELMKVLESKDWKTASHEVDCPSFAILALKEFDSKDMARFDCETSIEKRSDIVNLIPEAIAEIAGYLKCTRSKLMVHVVYNCTEINGRKFRYAVHIRSRQSMREILNEAVVRQIMTI